MIFQKIYSLFTRSVAVNTAKKESQDVEPSSVFSKAEQYELLERYRPLYTGAGGKCVVVDFGPQKKSNVRRTDG